jgi:hypothetical protein
VALKSKKISIQRPDDYDITILNPIPPDGQPKKLADTLHQVILAKAIEWVDIESDPDKAKELMKMIGLGEVDPEEMGEPIVIVSAPDGEGGEICALSEHLGSVLVHCEDKILPLTQLSDAKRKRSNPGGGAKPLSSFSEA